VFLVRALIFISGDGQIHKTVYDIDMYLYLDTTERDSFTVALISDNRVIKKKTVHSERKHSEKLLKTIAGLFNLSHHPLLRHPSPPATGGYGGPSAYPSSLRFGGQAKRRGLYGLKGIAVVCGPGSFTSLRIGVSTANALAYALGVSVVGVGKDEPLDKVAGLFSRVRPGRKTLDSRPRFREGRLYRGNDNIVLPEYGQEPNITMKK
jgi:hypothetical protein